ncbi:MAG: EAL domain-containing protein [Nevskia sp.]|nr:EAL domain-containing protein [Nevskia sp.]
MKLPRLSVRDRLLGLCLGLVAVFGSANLLLGFLVDSNERMQEEQQGRYRRFEIIQATDQALALYRHTGGQFTSAALLKNADQEASARASWGEAGHNLNTELGRLSSFDPASVAIIKGALDEEPKYVDRAIAALLKGQQDEAAPILAELQRRLDLIENTLDAASRHEHAMAEEFQRRERERVALSMRIATAVILVAAIVGVLLVLLVVRSIIRPLQTTTNAIRQVNAGEFELDLPPISHDEFGDMALALRQFRDNAEKLRRLAYQDPLTGLGNRVLLEESLQAAIDRSRGSRDQLSVFHLDLDNFRAVNERLGHKAGDRYLCEAAARLRRFIPPEALLCRYTGDKFIMLMEGLGNDPAIEQRMREAANTILRGVAEPYAFGGHLLNMSISIGIALFPADGESVEQLISSAEAAVYVAKKAGRNNARFAGAQLTGLARRQMALVGDIRRGLEMGEFEVYYQPIIDAVTRRVAAAEALLRWNHPERGLLLPGEFVQTAEDAGLIRQLGERCLTMVYGQLAQWRKAGRSIHVSVNLSARQVQDDNIIGWLAELRGRNVDTADLVEFELTESVLFDNSANTLKILEEIRKLGFRLGLDDFGTGYSSLSYLQRLPIDKIKIDRQFVSGMGISKQAMAIVSATLALARNLQLDVVAEGVETAQQVDMLLRYECRLLQGFHFAPAMPAVEFERWVADFDLAPA